MPIEVDDTHEFVQMKGDQLPPQCQRCGTRWGSERSTTPCLSQGN